jgi:hypothetical protein
MTDLILWQTLQRQIANSPPGYHARIEDDGSLAFFRADGSLWMTVDPASSPPHMFDRLVKMCARARILDIRTLGS